eukprot:NODE_864_length_3613_cov_0.374787.p4 type:complete len:115 gc:universal NODE_864_length_3613_cov_0.374787:1952-1608(-)
MAKSSTIFKNPFITKSISMSALSSSFSSTVKGMSELNSSPFFGKSLTTRLTKRDFNEFKNFRLLELRSLSNTALDSTTSIQSSNVDVLHNFKSCLEICLFDIPKDTGRSRSIKA